MKPFTDSSICRSRVHCPTCRAATPSGEHFRQSLSRLHILPPQFASAAACPRGLAVGDAVPDDTQERASVAATRRTPCVHLGLLVDVVRCQSCNGTVYIKLFHCGLHEKCSIERKVNGSAVCKTCPDYKAK